jgi:hypothetical protein
MNVSEILLFEEPPVPNEICSALSKEEKELFSWQSKYGIPKSAMQKLWPILSRSDFKGSSLRPSFKEAQGVVVAPFKNLEKKVFSGKTPKGADVSITCYSIKRVLTEYLKTPVGLKSLITKSNFDNLSFNNFTSGIYWNTFVESVPPDQIPLSILIFYDPYSQSKRNSVGNIYLGILNASDSVTNSPKTKLPICLLPYSVSIDLILGYIAEEIKSIEEKPLEVVLESGHKLLFCVRFSMFCGDSKVRLCVD